MNMRGLINQIEDDEDRNLAVEAVTEPDMRPSGVRTCDVRDTRLLKAADDQHVNVNTVYFEVHKREDAPWFACIQADRDIVIPPSAQGG